MLRILLDENVPVGLVSRLTGHKVRHVRDERWRGVSNGALLSAAESAGFGILITADQNLRFQQNLAGRALAIIVLSTNNWPRIRRDLPALGRAVDRVTPGDVHVVEIAP